MKGYSGKNIDLPLESAATTMRLLILISLIGLTLLSKAETLLKEVSFIIEMNKYKLKLRTQISSITFKNFHFHWYD